MKVSRWLVTLYGIVVTLVLANTFCCESGLYGGQTSASLGLICSTLIDVVILWTFVAVAGWILPQMLNTEGVRGRPAG